MCTMHPTPRNSLAIAAGILACSLAAGCRTPRRAVTTEGLPAKLTVRLAGLDETDRSKTDWIYELSGCTNTLNGKLEEDDQVVFTTVGLKRGLTSCEVRVRIINPAPSYTFAGPESGVLYLATGVEISQDADGALAAAAELQKLYGVTVSQDTRFVLKIPLVFPNAESGRLMSGLLDQCDPSFTASSVFEKTSDRGGTLSFTASVPTLVAVQCKTLRLDVDGIAQKYLGATTDPFKFTAKPGGEAELPSVTLALAAKDKASGKGVQVKTTPAPKQCNPTKEIYDIGTRTCKPKI